MASFDAESLHSNIPHDLGHDAIKYWLRKYPQALNNRFLKEFVLEAVDLVLKKQHFISMVIIIDRKKKQQWGQNLHQFTLPLLYAI